MHNSIITMISVIHLFLCIWLVIQMINLSMCKEYFVILCHAHVQNVYLIEMYSTLNHTLKNIVFMIEMKLKHVNETRRSYFSVVLIFSKTLLSILSEHADEMIKNRLIINCTYSYHHYISCLTKNQRGNVTKTLILDIQSERIGMNELPV